MLKFLPPLLVLQTFTASVWWLAPHLHGWAWLGLAVLASLGLILTAAWVQSLAQQQCQATIATLKECHAQEREKLRVTAERAKQKVIREAQQTALQEVRQATAQANLKVGMAFAGAAGIAGLLLLTQFMLLGLVALAATGGAAGGYMLRLRQERNKTEVLPAQTENAKLLNPSPRSR